MKRSIPILLVFAVVVASCRRDVSRRFYEPTDDIPQKSYQKVLRLHMKDGALYVFDEWQVTQTMVGGTGVWHDVERTEQKEGEFRVAIDDVALFETAQAKIPNHVLAMVGMTIGTGVGAGFCALAPKACFGSCPTFYVGDSDTIVAEGFSEAIAPSLERRDVDAIWGWEPTDRDAKMTMRNEALETHVVRHARLLAVPRADDPLVVRTNSGEFIGAGEPQQPASCSSEQGDCLRLVASSDRDEWDSQTDPDDLAATEKIELRFDDVPDGELGLVVRFRQTMVTTFLFYQAMAYMGSSFWQNYAKLDSSPGAWYGGISKYADIIGRIDVSVASQDGAWTTVGQIGETGPLAINTTVLPLGRGASGSVGLRLELARGNWRIDEIALVRLGDAREPIVLRPERAITSGPQLGEGRDVAAKLENDDETVVSLPGDAVDLYFALPEQPDRYAYYIDTRGYYIEWMREAWLKEENAWMAAMMVYTPRLALRVLAPKYKAVEAKTEELFWGSRYEN